MAQRAAFPESPDVFEKDDRVSFSKTSGSYLLEDELGEEWEWLPGPRKWTRTVRTSRTLS
jgi:HIV Tat-specific factor 1